MRAKQELEVEKEVKKRLKQKPMTRWLELNEGRDKVRLIADEKEMERLARQVGNCWDERVHHMNGNVYTVVENLPPHRYLVYDPVSDRNGLQSGKIFVPYQGVILQD